MRMEPESTSLPTDIKVVTKEEGTPVVEIKIEETVHRNASWGAIITIVVILVMIVVGAFYTWGQRVAEEHHLPATSTSQTSY
jgi:hypothetical protein